MAILIGLCVVTLCAIAYSIGRGQHNRTNITTGSELNTAADVNRQLATEQQRTADTVAAAIDTVAAIRAVTAKTDSALAELRELNRGSSDISAQIRAQAQLLADYFRSVNNLVNDGSSDTTSGNQ